MEPAGALVGLHYLGVEVPRYDYQLKGETYKRLCQVGQKIAEEMGKAGLEDTSLLAVDYFILDHLQVEPTLSQIRVGQQENGQGLVAQDFESKEAQFIHNDIRDKLKYWDYEKVLQVNESLQFVNESINELGLVPKSF